MSRGARARPAHKRRPGPRRSKEHRTRGGLQQGAGDAAPGGGGGAPHAGDDLAGGVLVGVPASPTLK